MRILSSLLMAALFLLIGGCNKPANQQNSFQIKDKELFSSVKNRALQIVGTGFTAGDSYGEVWIRDFNTFIELALDAVDEKTVEEGLTVFFRMQGLDGNILDGYIPVEKAQAGYDYLHFDLEPRYAGHKNTVETDQETSLVQAVYKYVKKTGHNDYLNTVVGDKTVKERMAMALEYLMNHRYSGRYGLIWGATTADWGDVQPEHEWGVYLTQDTHYAIDIYDNAMFLIAIQNYLELVPEDQNQWKPVHDQIAANTRKHLWDEANQKYIPHIYLNGSPFADSLDENQIYYHGGTAVAIEAGLLSHDEIATSLQKMVANVKASGAATIGLTLYPTYPLGSFKGVGMYPYGYQNGGDWTWFGARMIQQLIHHGFVEDAYREFLPMLQRIEANNGFFEWYSEKNEPKGSGTFRGEAGVVYKAIQMFEALEK
ncbi:MAG: hypothetical protein KBH01_03810 [Breznakibacter sp.]|nr:hypothetical protein [Breznakibacter sp.]